MSGWMEGNGRLRLLVDEPLPTYSCEAAQLAQLHAYESLQVSRQAQQENRLAASLGGDTAPLDSLGLAWCTYLEVPRRRL